MLSKKVFSERDSWTFFKFRIPLKYYLYKYKGKMNAFHRLLANGQRTFLGETNRDFWLKIKEGYYRIYFGSHHLYFVYILKIDGDNQPKLVRDFSIRIRKIINVKLEVGNINEMDEMDQILLSTPHGMKNYKQIRH